jgi:hypothetical protein
MPEFDDFDQYFDWFLVEHSKPATRALTYVGTAIELGALVAFVVRRRKRYLAVAAASSYAFAWVSHRMIERRPFEFGHGHPAWAVASIFRMAALSATGRIDAALVRARAAHPEP